MVAIVGSRVIASGIFRRHLRSQSESLSTVIFGAGPHGAELATALQSGAGHKLVAFIDDKRAIHGSTIHDVRVYPTSKLTEIIKKHKVKMVLLAIPDASRDRLRHVLNLIDEFPVHVKTMPAMSELLSGKASVADLREIDIEDLLGREPVAPDPDLMRSCITAKSVLVTGAGGSIGSELCRQILQLEPSTLVLVDNSEFSLYQIERELREMAKLESRYSGVHIVALLASIEDKKRLTAAMTSFGTNTVYHAAAYKHVPTVEANPVIAVRNNIFGTKSLVETAVRASVDAFIMVSTDKAVRPRSVMGATKNLAEQVVRMIDQQTRGIRFSIVRFGNVIGSSGSVVPLFREQIAKGGPVTVTDEGMERYFMTIPEAAQLVIQAGAIGSGGEQYVLDMGEPVKVLELAQRMIRLSGLRVKDEKNSDGDIDIQITGLRPGEKMYEETYHSEDVVFTSHPRINKEQGIEVDTVLVAGVLRRLEQVCADDRSELVRGLLKSAVPGYVPYENTEDPVWNSQGSQQSSMDLAGSFVTQADA
jgi:FlaA1/EpsC-like NDP-sugar epimerase